MDRPERLAAAYFGEAEPEELLYDEIEALWAAIADRDDWGPFERQAGAHRGRPAGVGLCAASVRELTRAAQCGGRASLGPRLAITERASKARTSCSGLGPWPTAISAIASYSSIRSTS